MSDLMKINTGNPYPLGAYVINDTTINFAVVMSGDLENGIVLYNNKTHRESRVTFREHNRIGNIYCVRITGIDVWSYSYNFYEGDRVFTDPYGKAILGNEKWGRTPGSLKGGFVLEDRHRSVRCPSMIKYSDSVFYLIHVRGFTRHKSSGVEHPGTFSGVTEKIPYLKSLGVTTIELMPAYEFIELDEPETTEEIPVIDAYAPVMPKLNYWGYKKGYYFSPKASYAESGVKPSDSFHAMVQAIHDAGMELVMQFYFPAGIKQAMILEILKFWVHEYHVDGFHLMGDRMPLALLGTEPMLANTKLMYYGFPVDEIYGQQRPAYKNLADCNDNFMYDIRRFLKSDEGQIGAVMNDMKDIDNRISRVHYITNSNGFTLMDLVSYDRKHNEANGENDRDGSAYNASWNCGYEGPTARKSVTRLRRRQIRNAIVFNVLSQGAPLILGGDEFGNSQKGNNNPYCIDGPLTWLNWKDLDKNQDIYDFYKALLDFRRDHGILHMDRPFRMSDYCSCGYPDLSYHGDECWKIETDVLTRHFAMLYAEGYSKLREGEIDAAAVSGDDFIFIAVNMHWSAHTFALPKLKNGRKWIRVFDTSLDSIPEAEELKESNRIIVKDRSIVILRGCLI